MHTALGLPLPCSLGSWKVGCSSDAELSPSSLEECRRDTVGRKGVKGLLPVGHEEVPRGFGLRTRDRCSDTAGGAGNCRRPASQAQIAGKNQGLPKPWTSIFFPEIWYLRLGKVGKEGLCVCGYSKGLWDFNEDIKSLVLSLYNF
ncbi:hypothetical protein HJG60_008475 [Phyllostomus discolor]|uniref:Uncharacterized protein n=1 Tax=Phyllostomus discolor TaxID=89673 RepID=A0A833YX89_9CHIR|nr:hypothetical protein HJG60_008475 [Phyllostomus discolor]